MTISERLFIIMAEKNITGYKLSKLTGISRQTINDWHKKNTNPGADKIMLICEALEIMPEELLIGNAGNVSLKYDLYASDDELEIQLVKDYHELSDVKKKRLLAYMNMLQNLKE